MKVKMSYSTPDGYFKNLDSRIMDNIVQKSGLRQRLVHVMAFAASAAVLLGIGGFIVGQISSPTAQTALTDDEIIEYLIDSGAPLAYFEESL